MVGLMALWQSGPSAIYVTLKDIGKANHNLTTASHNSV